MQPDNTSPLVGHTTSHRWHCANAVLLCDRCEDEQGVTAGADAGDTACSACGQERAPHIYPALAEVERLREAITYALSIVRDACEDLDDDGRQAMASALHTAHDRLARALDAGGHKHPLDSTGKDAS
jgi:hypothetical protein